VSELLAADTEVLATLLDICEEQDEAQRRR